MIQRFPTAELLADAVARHIADCAADAMASTGRFTLALAGGSTPRAAYQRLATGDAAHQLDWQRTHVLWGDERCVPPVDPRSNYRMAKEVLLDRVPVPATHVHRIRGEDDPAKAAADYEDTLRGLLREEAHPSSECHPERQRRIPKTAASLRMTNSLDLVLLGLGEDGHTASLFPGQPSVHEVTRWVLAVPAPDGTLWRVTLTPAILNVARNVTFIVAGASKARRLADVLEGPFHPDLLPAQAIRPVRGRLTWMVDAAASSRLLSPIRDPSLRSG
jgi:6-phosphogluconolactonase